MKIRLIALDMDGTALKTDGTVSERLLRAVEAASRIGVIVVPATGRVKKMLPEPFRNLPSIRYAITSNGAAVWDLRTGEILYSNPMSTEDSLSAIRFFSSRGLMTEAYCRGVSYSEKSDFIRLQKLHLPEKVYQYILKSQNFVENLSAFLASNGFSVEKINIPYVPETVRRELISRLSCTGRYTVTSSGSVNLEVNSSTCSKGDALGKLCLKVGVSPSQVMAIGDSDNDVTMLKYAGFAVAMENAVPSARQTADFITGTNDSDGAAYAVENFALSGDSGKV